MTIRRLLVAAVLAATLAGGVPAASAADNAWLLGRWELVRDDDGSPKDWLEFAGDGRVFLIKPNGERLAGRYVTAGTGVQLHFTVGSRSLTIPLAPSSDRKQLLTRSGQTGKTGVYEKQP